ncbi:DUF3426 domain-containing protein [Paracidovorax sp. MALMAid1276]|uniref:DUF3426 domain-containing protein n=1 Tax=Paracidovorax sp. MALMAid1276 TaxID=3411631 RepID=UPI003B9A5C5B
MSQITRCPSCATSFKVVADQLRISEGWVRCGQCKEVFDASAHLLPSAPPALLPDVSLTDAKPRPAPVVRAPDAGRAWGAPSPAAPRQSPGGMPPHSPPAPAVPPAAATPSFGEAVAQAPVMDVPTPAVPAFLAAREGDALVGDLGLEPSAPFAWRAPPDVRPLSPAEPLAERAGGLADPAGRAVAGQGGGANTDLNARSPANAEDGVDADGTDDRDETGDAPPGFVDTVPASLDMLESYEPLELPSPGARPQRASFTDPARTPVAPSVPTVPGGYELPVAELPDSDWPVDVLDTANTDARATELPEGRAATDTAARAEETRESEPALHIPDISFPALHEAAPSEKPATAVVADAAADAHGADALALVADDSAAAVLRADPRRGASTPAHDDADDEEPHADPEVSFVRAARRQAFWRQAWVRGVLLLLTLALLTALGAQVAVQERDRIAAMEPRARPWLTKLCEPLRCEIAAPRQIADVVIDSSSFNKARGDSYQLAFTMKNQSAMPLAMPAVELTLTDAQDQAVLRRVLLPADLAAPAELPARGEWSASVAVIVTTGGARVAGYRVLAFYP